MVEVGVNAKFIFIDYLLVKLDLFKNKPEMGEWKSLSHWYRVMDQTQDDKEQEALFPKTSAF
jgi:hypothetical protein